MNNNKKVQVLRSALGLWALAACAAACSPDDPSLGGMNYSPESIREGQQYKIEVTQGTNHVTMTSLTSEQSLWITPNGRSQAREFSIDLPFAGDYEISYGVETPGGYVYGEPFKFTLEKSNTALLTDPMWSYLTGYDPETGSGSKTWVPLDKDYNLGNTVFFQTYIDPEHPLNDGNEGKVAWHNAKPNWDPGFQGWLYGDAPSDADAKNVQESEMTFSLNAADGAVVSVKEVKQDGTVYEAKGKFNLNLDDKGKPTITVDGIDRMVANPNYGCMDHTNMKTGVLIYELNNDIFQVAAWRDACPNDGVWYVGFSYIAKAVKEGTQEITREESGAIPSSPVVTPGFSNEEEIATQLFTAETGGHQGVFTDAVFTINEEKPYNWAWWNASTAQWQDVAGDYNETWAPKATPESIAVVNDDEGLVLKDDGTWSGAGFTPMVLEDKTKVPTYEVSKDGVISFYDSDGSPATLAFVTATSDLRTIEIKGSSFQIISPKNGDMSEVDLGSGMRLGLMYDDKTKEYGATKNDAGAQDCYPYVNLERKPYATAQGPTVVKVDMAKLQEKSGWADDESYKGYRICLFSSYDPKPQPVENTKLSIPKGKKMVVKLKVSGFNFVEGAKPKIGAISNTKMGDLGGAWEPDCYTPGKPLGLADFVEGQEVTLTIDNQSGAKWSCPANDCLQLSIQTRDADKNPICAVKDDDLANVIIEQCDITIE